MTSSSYSVFHAIASIHPKTGGPARSVVSLADTLANQSTGKQYLITKGTEDALTVSSTSPLVTRFVLSPKSKLADILGSDVREALRGTYNLDQQTIVHNHGIWLPFNHWVVKAAVANKLKLVTHPRGMLAPWCMNHNQTKKKIAMLLYQRKDLKACDALVATSAQEHDDLRDIGCKNPIAVIPNGVGCEPSLRTRVSSKKKCRKILFVSRIHPVKGLINLVQAWAIVRPQGWQLLLAGPDEAGHLNEVYGLIGDFGLGESVRYVGEVHGEQKKLLFEEADLFVLPSFSENFVMVVAEALSFGLPVITTTGTPWHDLDEIGAGWCVSPDVPSLVNSLTKAISATDADRLVMGAKAKAYSMQFGWPGVADKMDALYQWLLGRSEKPDYVLIVP